jgi:hypothetical protein
MAQVKCSSKSVLTCGKKCEKELNCTVHKCTQPCHTGECEQCTVLIKLRKFMKSDSEFSKLLSSFKFVKSCPQLIVIFLISFHFIQAVSVLPNKRTFHVLTKPSPYLVTLAAVHVESRSTARITFAPFPATRESVVLAFYLQRLFCVVRVGRHPSRRPVVKQDFPQG